MSLLVAGTIAFDTIEAPHAAAERVLGGSGVFATAAAGHYSTPRLVGVVGDDFPAESRRLLAAHGVDLAGVETRPGRRTQFWRGRYHADLHTREHLEVDLSIFDGYDPVVPEPFRDSTHVLLAHMPPHLQLRILEQVTAPRFIVADTIDHWINTCRADLLKLWEQVDGVALNDQEARLLTGEGSLLKAARAILKMGPSFVVVKKGEHGALVHTGESFYTLPAYPTDVVVDPTGAGDSFAGGMVGFLDHLGESTLRHLTRAVAAGVVTASFTVEGFGPERLFHATRTDLLDRQSRYRELLAV